MEEEEDETTAQLDLIKKLYSMGNEELISFLEEYLADVFDPGVIRENLSGDQAEEYKRLLISSIAPNNSEELNEDFVVEDESTTTPLEKVVVHEEESIKKKDKIVEHSITKKEVQKEKVSEKKKVPKLPSSSSSSSSSSSASSGKSSGDSNATNKVKNKQKVPSKIPDKNKSENKPTSEKPKTKLHEQSNVPPLSSSSSNKKQHETDQSKSKDKSISSSTIKEDDKKSSSQNKTDSKNEEIKRRDSRDDKTDKPKQQQGSKYILVDLELDEPSSSSSNKIKKKEKSETEKHEKSIKIKEEKLDKEIKIKQEKDQDKDKKSSKHEKSDKKTDHHHHHHSHKGDEKKKEHHHHQHDKENKNKVEDIRNHIKVEKKSDDENEDITTSRQRHDSLEKQDKIDINKDIKKEKDQIDIDKEINKEKDTTTTATTTTTTTVCDTFPSGYPKIKIGAPLFIDPDFNKFKKKFKLKHVQINLYNIKKQNVSWRDGDKVHRKQVREERKQRKHDKHSSSKHDKTRDHMRHVTINERGVRILPFETKREPKGEIIKREKPKSQPINEKMRRLEELQKKEEKSKEKPPKVLQNDFRIPKAAGNPNRPTAPEPVTTTTTINPTQKRKVEFDQGRLPISTQNKQYDSWAMTPEEEQALKKQAEPEPEPYTFEEYDIPDNDNPEIIDLDDEPDGSDEILNTESPFTPMKEVVANDIALGVVNLLNEKGDADIEILEDGTSSREDALKNKCSRWFQQNTKEPYFQLAPSIPENTEEDFYTLMNVAETVDDDEESFYGNVSNPDGAGSDFLQDNEVSSTYDPEKANEYCGCSLLSAKIRIGGTGTEEAKEERFERAPKGQGLNLDPRFFKNIFDVKKGTNYDKQNFQAACNLCSELIVGTRELATHVRSEKHRQKLAQTSLNIIGMEAKITSGRLMSTEEVEISSEPGGGSDTRSSHQSRSKDKDKKERDTKEKDKNKSKEKERNGHKSSLDKKDDKRIGKQDQKKDGSDSSHTTLRSVIQKGSNVDRQRGKKSRSKSPGGRKFRRSRSRSPRHHDRHRRSRSPDRGRNRRSRSRHRRSRSRSPHHHHHDRNRKSRSPRDRNRRPSSKERVDSFLARNERAASRRSPISKTVASKIPKSKQEENLIFNKKLALEASGKWTPELETRWKLKEDDEEQLKRQLVLRRKLMEEKPEEHPMYATKWGDFWTRRYEELIQAGKSTEYAENYDYTNDWKIEWNKFVDHSIETERDARLHEIRIKYGMDYETLKALDVQPPPPVPIVTSTPYMPPFVPNQVPPGMNLYRGPPPASVFPVGVPPPRGLIPPVHGLIPSVHGLIPPAHFSGAPPLTTYAPPPAPVPAPIHITEPVVVASTSVPVVQPIIVPEPVRRTEGADYTAKSMSISDSGSERSHREKGISSKPKVTVDDIKSTWLSLTGQKINAAVVEAATKSKSGASKSGSSIASSHDSHDYDGFDVVQVLRLMCGLEEELSFFAPKIQEAYKQAEEMELGESRKSFTMLKDREFVTLLFQCRDKFNSILRANVSSSEVMKKLNLTVYAMNALLESPNCQKLRPSAPISLSVDNNKESGNIPKPSVSNVGSDHSRIKASNVSDIHESVTGDNNPISAALAHLPVAKRIEISSVIATSLIAQGKDRLSKSELMQVLLTIFAPILSNSSGFVKENIGGGKSGSSSAFPLEISTTKSSLPSAPSSFTKATSNIINNIESSYGDQRPLPPEPIPVRNYSAIPPLPEFSARAVSPPPEKKFAQERQLQQGFGMGTYVPNPLARSSGRPTSPRRFGGPALDQDVPVEEVDYVSQRRSRSESHDQSDYKRSSYHDDDRRSSGHRRKKKKSKSKHRRHSSSNDDNDSEWSYSKLGHGSRSRSPKSNKPSSSSRQRRRRTRDSRGSGTSSTVDTKVKSKRHHRSKTEKRKRSKSSQGGVAPDSKVPEISKVPGVSKTFWNPGESESCISSEDNFDKLESKDDTCGPPKEQKSKPSYRNKKDSKMSTYPILEKGEGEEGEIISSSETDLSSHVSSQLKTVQSVHSNKSETWD